MPRRFTVARSGIHGRGVFARAPLRAGEVVLDYAGEVIDWDEANRRYQDSSVEDGHTFYFDLGDGQVLDGGRGGNSSRWINHSCAPNCVAAVEGGRVVISARRDIAAGEELSLDYQLQIDPAADEEERALYSCRCGVRTCRTTMLDAG